MTYSLLLMETVQAFSAGVVSSRRYTERLLARIREWEPSLHAWATLDEARALALADAADRILPEEACPLRGVPFGVKDIIDTADLPTQMGSPMFAGHRPGRDAAIVERLKRAGAFVLGKTHSTEFAFMHPAPTRNPWNLAHTPGGSSAGSAAAVAAGFVPAAIGTQTNGSVIRPAAFCGVVGFKPSFGLLPWAGGLQFAETLDQMGTFARSVADVAFITAPLAEGEAISSEPARLVRAPRLALLKAYPWNNTDLEMLAHVDTTANRLRAAGAVVDEIQLPPALADANVVHRTLMLYEGARQHVNRQREHRAQLSPELNQALDAGGRIMRDEYQAAVANRAVAIERLCDVLDGFDGVLSPPAPGAAPQRLDVTGDPSFCTLWSLAGFPVICIPTGFSREGLPFGLQIAALAGHDDRLLAVAAWCEAQIGFEGSP